MVRWHDKPKAERQADIAHHKAMRAAAEQAANRLRDECIATNQLNSAVIEAEREIPWWRR